MRSNEGLIDETNQGDILDRVASLYPSARKVEVVGFLPGGWSNHNYRLRIDGVDSVLRIKLRTLDKPGTEIQYLSTAISPNLLAYDPNSGDMITNWVEGELLCDTHIKPCTAAAYLNELHRHIPMGVTTYDVHRTIRNYLAGSDIDKQVLDIYNSLLWEPQISIGCHNELNAWNVIRTADGFCTLDWESAGDNDPIFDLVGFCYGLRFSDDEVNACNSAYVNPTDSDHLCRTRILYQIREHAWAVDRIKSGSLKPEIHEQLISSREEILRLNG